MSHLLDSSVLIACGWEQHPSHAIVNRWLDRTPGFATCPLVQMAFIRVSLTVAFGAFFNKAQEGLAEVISVSRHKLVDDTIAGNKLPHLWGHKEVTDAHLVLIAQHHGLRLATLDKALCTKPWAQGVAEYVG